MVIYCINNNLLLNAISVEGTLFVNDTNGLVLSYETTTASVQNLLFLIRMIMCYYFIFFFKQRYSSTVL